MSLANVAPPTREHYSRARQRCALYKSAASFARLIFEVDVGDDPQRIPPQAERIPDEIKHVDEQDGRDGEQEDLGVGEERQRCRGGVEQGEGGRTNRSGENWNTLLHASVNVLTSVPQMSNIEVPTKGDGK